MKSFENKVAAITGAGSGIGRALACHLARQGCHLALSDINVEGLRSGFTRYAGLGALTALVVVAQMVSVYWVKGLGIDAMGLQVGLHLLCMLGLQAFAAIDHEAAGGTAGVDLRLFVTGRGGLGAEAEQAQQHAGDKPQGAAGAGHGRNLWQTCAGECGRL